MLRTWGVPASSCLVPLDSTRPHIYMCSVVLGLCCLVGSSPSGLAANIFSHPHAIPKSRGPLGFGQGSRGSSRGRVPSRSVPCLAPPGKVHVRK